MKSKTQNQTLNEINDSKIIAIDYYKLEKLFNGLQNTECQQKMLVMLKENQPYQFDESN